METNRSLNPESPKIDPEQIKPGEIWEISRCVQAPIGLELQEEHNINSEELVKWSLEVEVLGKNKPMIGIIDTGFGGNYNDIIDWGYNACGEWVLPLECIEIPDQEFENTPHGTPIAGIADGVSSNTGSMELNAIAPLKLYPTSAQSFFNGNSPPRYVMIVTEPEPPEDLADEWRVISVMMLSVKSDRLSDVDILIPSDVSGVGQDLLAETWNVVPMLACNLLRPVGRRLSRAIYDVLLDVGDYYNELTETPVLPHRIESFGLRFGSASAKEAPGIQAFHQQEEDWAAVLELPVAAYRAYLKTIQETENLLEIAIEVEREFGELQENPNPGRHQSLIHLSQWFQKAVEEGWQPIEEVASTSAGTSGFRFRGIENIDMTDLMPGQYSVSSNLYLFQASNDNETVDSVKPIDDKCSNQEKDTVWQKIEEFIENRSKNYDAIDIFNNAWQGLLISSQEEGVAEIKSENCPSTGKESIKTTFGGTSAAPPLVSGCIGLLLETNPNLTWRDVQANLLALQRSGADFGGNWSEVENAAIAEYASTYNGEVGIFNIDGMDELALGSEAFIQEAAFRALSNSELGYAICVSPPLENIPTKDVEATSTHAEKSEEVEIFTMHPGDRVGLIAVPDGKLQDVFENPVREGTKLLLFIVPDLTPPENVPVSSVDNQTEDEFQFDNPSQSSISGEEEGNSYIFSVSNDGVEIQLSDAIRNSVERCSDYSDYVESEAVDMKEFSVWDELKEEGVVIGIVDDGVEYQHRDLAQNYSDNSTSNFDPSTEDNAGEDAATDDAGENGADVVLDEAIATPEINFDMGTFKVDASGEVSIDFLFDGGAFKSQVAIVSLSGMEGLDPNSIEFIREAATRAASNTELGHIVIDDISEGAKFTGRLREGDWNSNTYEGVKTVTMRPGDEFFLMLVPNGTVQQVVDNPNVQGAIRPLFSFATANPNDEYHVGQIADLTGDGGAFAWEDLRADRGTDRDYNDIVLQIRGAKRKAALMDEVVGEGKDWRNTDMGQALTDKVEKEEAIAPIETLIERLQSESDERNRQQVAKQLGQIGRGDADAIDALSELISTTEDEETLWTAVESLWQIAPDCPAAGVRRGKLFQLGQQSNSETVALTVALVEKPADNIGILLRVYPTGNQLCVPTDLQLILCDESGANLFPPVISRPGDAYIQLKLSGLPGEQFSVTLALAENSITEHFLI